jgi:hypothetical protein
MRDGAIAVNGQLRHPTRRCPGFAARTIVVGGTPTPYLGSITLYTGSQRLGFFDERFSVGYDVADEADLEINGDGSGDSLAKRPYGLNTGLTHVGRGF